MLHLVGRQDAYAVVLLVDVELGVGQEAEGALVVLCGGSATTGWSASFLPYMAAQGYLLCAAHLSLVCSEGSQSASRACTLVAMIRLLGMYSRGKLGEGLQPYFPKIAS